MLSPKLLASTPFRDRTALYDLAGTLQLYFVGLAQVSPTQFRLLPIGTPGGSVWMAAVQEQFRAAGDALGVNIPDLASYDLADARDFASWTFTMSETLEQLRLEAGVA